MDAPPPESPLKVARVNLVYDPAGIPCQGGVQVSMAGAAAEKHMESTFGLRTIWTMGMTGCRTVATFDHFTRQRTLTHLYGGQANFSFWQTLASMISGYTTVIFSAGHHGSEWHFSEKDCVHYKAELERALREADKESAITKIEYVELFEVPDGTVAGTFAIQGDGRYGRARRPLPS